jgi:MFS family permease
MFKPSESLSHPQVKAGLSYVTKDGIFTEAMVAFTGGTFLVAMAMHMGASNVQIGLLAALPTLSNIFQLASIWLVQRYNNRRAISVICNFLARFPLLAIGIIPFIYSAGTSVTVLIFLLFFHYTLGSIAGASWNSWMKDLVPEERLGNYFSYRARLMQIINVVMSILTALAIDYIKARYPQYETVAYPAMFLAGGIAGMLGVWMMGLTPEPKSCMQNGQILKLMRKPLQDENFRKFLLFNCSWAFSLNLATPFFSVYLLKTLNIGLSTIIALNILSQVSSIVFVRIWGNYADRFSNKTVIRICAPVYIGCIVGWSLVGNHILTIPFLILIHVVSGITTGGINLSINNIGLKLAAKDEAIVYIASRNMVNAFIPALAPIFGGIIADFLTNHNFIADFSLNIPLGNSVTTVFHFTNWTIFFVFSAAMGVLSLRFLKNVKEEGEVEKGFVMHQLVRSLRVVRYFRKELVTEKVKTD